ncbi:MAG: Fic family protein [Bacteroidaceae bacterium]|nr:Fic family protein [Bacteroidaceae bacterium]
MHAFKNEQVTRTLLTPEIVQMLTALHEHRGRQEFFIEAEPDVLSALLDLAKVQSTKASNKIEGIFTSDERLEALVRDKSAPRNRSEEEIAGYREVLATIHESYPYIPVRPSSILQLHRDLYSFSSSDLGGRFKDSDNIIAEQKADGMRHVRFQPTPAYQTPEAVEKLCQSWAEMQATKETDPLLLVPIFVLDFLCIHPFNDGNGRISRLLTLLLLYQCGYIVGKYISLEMLIEKTKETYYETLQASSTQWHDNSNDYTPFVKYYLGILLKAYKEFEDRVAHLHHRMSKANRVKAVFNQTLGKVSKAYIAEHCPDISLTTIERTLKELLDEGYISKVGAGRATAYVKR